MNYPQQGWPSPSGMPYGGQPSYPPAARPSALLARLTAALFIACAGFAIATGIVSLDGAPTNLHLFSGVLGLMFSEAVTGDVTFALIVTMAVGALTLVFAVLLACRFRIGRPMLAVLGLLVAGYYAYTAIALFGDNLAGYTVVPIAAGAAWLLGMVLVLLPPVGRALGRHAQPQPPLNVPPPGMPTNQPPPGQSIWPEASGPPAGHTSSIQQAFPARNTFPNQQNW
ncbi:hypothetical protein EV191_10349 [Tamaricihabitans halophyticus]|uniref:Uncharacterized protein n=1 Tax=Tamaricihabitans halophyticus TaxID=1262583 RepID=A0A4R2QXW5_9PSEU|nr:hypothetical protein [Tamaricihabitans halophyticus]TCP54009.1 hypothetical protein EV191_10349 [Tamaricihabitans halophyticus]